MTGRAKVVDRVRKLLALAGNKGAAESEAETARRLADAMLEAAGLTEEDIGEEDDPVATVADVEQPVTGSPREMWRSMILLAICRVVGVHPYTSRGSDGRMRLRVIGTAQARETVAELIPWVFRQVARAMRNAHPPAGLDAERRRLWVRSYRYGLADGIAAQARSVVEHRSAAPAESTALARRDAIAAAIERAKPRLGKGRRRVVYVDGSARAAGENDAASIALQRRAAGVGVRQIGAGS